jgi:hypothetical protein
MKTELSEIKPGAGLGAILFGMSREQVRKLMGEPDEIESNSHDDDEDDVTESWHYDDIEVSISFEKIEDWKLCTIAVSDSDAVLNGKKPIGMSADEITEMLLELDVKKPIREDWSSAESPDYHSITAEERASGLRGQDDLPWRLRNHGLFIGYAPAASPRYAVAVVVEHGGGGSTAAARPARDILRDLVERDPAARAVGPVATAPRPANDASAEG